MDIAHNKAVVAQFDELGNRSGVLAILDTLCTPDMVNHALAAGRPQGLEGTREFLRRARREIHGGRRLSSIVVAEGDMVVQFGTRELTWPGGSFLGFETPPGTASRDVAFAYRLVDGRIAERWAIRDHLPCSFSSEPYGADWRRPRPDQHPLSSRVEPGRLRRNDAH